MSASSTKLGDDFLRIPKLDVSGNNWVIFKDRFIWALDARCLLDHIDGTGSEPADPITEGARAKAVEGKEPKGLSAEQIRLETEWKKDVREWKQGEAVAKQQIASSIPDSLFMKVRSKGTAREIWIELENHFQKRSRMVSIDLRRRLQEQRCPEKGDVVAHFATLRTMREDLAAMGQPLSDTDFYTIIMGSLPPSYNPYISAVNATSSVMGSTLSADELMLTLTEEFERRALKSKGKGKDDNAAFYSNDASSSKGQKKPKRKGKCHNCGKEGHWTINCWEEGGGQEGKGPKQKAKKSKAEKQKGKGKDSKETAAAAKEEKKDEAKGKETDEEAWMAVVMDNVLDTIYLEPEEDPDNDLYGEAYSCFIEDETCVITPLEADVDISDPLDGLDGPDELLSADQELGANSDDAPYTSFNAAYLAGTDETRSAEVDLYDSGATRHMSGFRHRFFNFTEIHPIPITAADKRTFQAIGKGDMHVYVPSSNSESTSRILLKDVLYAPTMGVTLVSISRIAGTGSTVVFSGSLCRIYNKNRALVGEIKVKGGLYRVFTPNSGVGAYSFSTRQALSINELHRRLGHVSHERAKLLVKKGLIEGIDLESDVEATVCESCEWAKGERKSITKVREGERRTAVGDEVHSDLWGPAPVESINHKRYYVSFTDDYSRYTQVYFLHTKDETFDSYRVFEAWLSTQHSAKIKCLRSDRGGEYLSDEFSAYLRKAGTVRNLTVHHTPEHNGVAERLNRTLLEKVRAMLHESDLPKFLWAEAISHAVYLKNRTWTRAIGETTPYELLNGQKPNLGNLHPWGCRVRVHNTGGSKLDGRSSVGRWMGFDAETRMDIGFIGLIDEQSVLRGV